MLPQRKLVVLSRFFQENVQLVANMCVQCYQQEDEVKVTGINRKFIDLIESRRLEPLQKRQKLQENDCDNSSFNIDSEELSSEHLDASFAANSSSCSDFEAVSSESRNVNPREHAGLNEKSSSNVSLEGSHSNLHEDSNTNSSGTCGVVENSSTNNSCYSEVREGMWDQDSEDSFSRNSNIVVNCSETVNIRVDNSPSSNDSVISKKASFAGILKKSNGIIQQSCSENCVDKTENNSSCTLEHSAAKIEDRIPNNTYEWLLQSNNALNANSTLNEITLNHKPFEDASSASSEEDFNLLEDLPAKAKCDGTSQLQNTMTTFSQSIFKTLNSKNSRLYDDFSTNINGTRNLKLKPAPSFNYNVNKLQLPGCATMNKEEMTSFNYDKRRGFSSKHNEGIRLAEASTDDNIAGVITRVCSPIDVLSTAAERIKSEASIDDSDEDSVENLIKNIRNSIKNESSESSAPGNPVNERSPNEKINRMKAAERIGPTSAIDLRNVSECLMNKGSGEKAKSLDIETSGEEEMDDQYCKNGNGTSRFTVTIIGNGETNSSEPLSIKYNIRNALHSSAISSGDAAAEQECSRYFSARQTDEDLTSSATRHSGDSSVLQSSASPPSALPSTQEKPKNRINFASLRNGRQQDDVKH